MEKNRKRNIKKIRRRLTDRQKVLQVYSNASIDKHREIYVLSPIVKGSPYHDYHVLSDRPDDPLEYKKINFVPPWTAKEAWHRAWLTTQEDMIKKLES